MHSYGTLTRTLYSGDMYVGGLHIDDRVCVCIYLLLNQGDQMEQRSSWDHSTPENRTLPQFGSVCQKEYVHEERVYYVYNYVCAYVGNLTWTYSSRGLSISSTG